VDYFVVLTVTKPLKSRFYNIRRKLKSQENYFTTLTEIFQRKLNPVRW